MTIIERIIMYADDKHIRRKDIYAKCNIPQSTFSSWICANVTSIPSEYIPTLASLFDISCDKLLTGEDYKGKSDDRPEWIKLYDDLDWEGQQIVTAKIITEKRRMEREKVIQDGSEQKAQGRT